MSKYKLSFKVYKFLEKICLNTEDNEIFVGSKFGALSS